MYISLPRIKILLLRFRNIAIFRTFYSNEHNFYIFIPLFTSIPGTEYKRIPKFSPRTQTQEKRLIKEYSVEMIKVINQRIEGRGEESKVGSNFRLNSRILSYISGGGGLWKQAACLWLQGLRVESTLRYSDNYLSSRVFRTQCHRSRLVHGEAAPGSVE